MKVALVYDRINKWGGAERILLALHKIWPEAPLYTSVCDKSSTPWADYLDVRTSFLQKLPLPKKRHEYYPYLMGLAFETFTFDEYDVVISVTHEFAKAIITKPKTLHICYCLNPVGYLWSGYDAYFSQKSNFFRQASLPIIKYLRWYDQIIAQRPDQYVAISNTVAERIKKYYRRDSAVIYPPVTLAGGLNPMNTKYKILNNKYYLIVSRLVPEKRLDIAIDAFNQLGLPLKIVGTGSEERNLHRRAKRNIEFLGYLTEEDLRRYYKSCEAVVIPGEEDFNLVAVEAQSFGKPVLAYNRGGVLETVLPGKTGWFWQKQTAENLVNLIETVKLDRIRPEDCRKNASRFAENRFESEFRNYVERAYDQYRRTSSL